MVDDEASRASIFGAVAFLSTLVDMRHTFHPLDTTRDSVEADSPPARRVPSDASRQFANSSAQRPRHTSARPVVLCQNGSPVHQRSGENCRPSFVGHRAESVVSAPATEIGLWPRFEQG